MGSRLRRRGTETQPCLTSRSRYLPRVPEAESAVVASIHVAEDGGALEDGAVLGEGRDDLALFMRL